MPPAAFIALSVPVNSISGGVTKITALTPSIVAPGDTLLTIIASEAQVQVDTALNADGWMSIGRVVNGASALQVCRRIATDNEPALHSLYLRSGDSCTALFMAYRGLDPGQGLVGMSCSPQPSSGGAAFSCHSQTMQIYSDVYFGVALSISSTHFFPFTSRQNMRFNDVQTQLSVVSTLGVFDYYPESAGATGAQVLNAAGHGMYGSFAMKSLSAPVVKMLKPDVPGAIGLTTIGV